MYIGVDVGGTKIQFAVYTEGHLEILNKETTPSSYENFLTTIKTLCTVLEKEKQQKVLCIGLGIPGTITDERISWVPNITYLNNKYLIKDLAEILQTNVIIGNDAQLALLGEIWMGAGVGKNNAALISLGTGVGGAIMIGGKLVKGRNGAAGAFGWVNLNIFEENDKGQGYLEKYISGRALERLGAKIEPPLTSYEIIEKAREGNKLCRKIMSELGHKLGSSLAIIASVLDTEMIIIGGGLSEVIDTYKENMNISMEKYSAPGINVPVIKSKLGNLSGVYGAIRLAIIQEKTWV